MLLIGLLLMLVPASFGGWLAYENRATVVHVQLGSAVWTGRLYEVFVLGALVACWFLLGAAFIQCRIAERRRTRAAAADQPSRESRSPQRQPQRTPAERSAPVRAAAAGAVRRAASPG